MPGSPAKGIELRLLGPIEARLDERSIALGAPKQRAVLAMLALQAGRTVSADRLAEGLWGEQPPASAPKKVQLYRPLLPLAARRAGLSQRAPHVRRSAPDLR